MAWCLREILLDCAQAFGVVLVAAMVAFLINVARPNPLSWQRESEDLLLARQIDSASSNVTPEIALVTLDEAVELLAEEKAIFADARDEEFFKLGHIPGAQALPRNAFAKFYAEFSKKARPSDQLVIYCSSEDCKDAETVARALARLGYRDVKLFAGGWEEWQAAGQTQER